MLNHAEIGCKARRVERREDRDVPGLAVMSSKSKLYVTEANPVERMDSMTFMMKELIINRSNIGHQQGGTVWKTIRFRYVLSRTAFI